MRKPPAETRPIREAAAPRGAGQTAKLPAPRPRSAWGRLGKTILLVLPAIFCTVALVVIMRRPAEMCRQWELAARRAEGATADELVERLDRYGRFGLPALVRLLRAESGDTVTAACRTLTARLEKLRDGADNEDREALAMIAAELTTTFGRSSDKAPQEAVDLALLLLATTGRLGLDEQLDADLRSRLFAACEDVLRRAPPSLDAPPVPLVAILPDAPPIATKSTVEPVVDPAPPQPVANIADLPTPRSLPPPQVQAPAPLTAANAAARITAQPEVQADAAVRPVSIRAPLTTANELPDRTARESLLRADAWTLFIALHGPDRGAAETELHRRGFSQRELELGEHLTSDDPQERRRFARELPALDVTESKPWLLRLCRDEDAEVRRIAVTIMATTNDPALQELLRRLSIDDADDEVRLTAGRATGRVQR